MPTIIVVDTSLSMLRPLNPLAGICADPDISEEDTISKLTLALEVVNRFIDHVSAHCKLEFVSLVSGKVDKHRKIYAEKQSEILNLSNRPRMANRHIDVIFFL